MSPILTGGTVYFGTSDGGWTEIGYVDGPIELTYEPVLDEPVVPFESFSMTRSVSVTYRLSKVSAAAYRLFFNRRHPRLRSMHCSYSRRLRARRRRSR